VSSEASEDSDITLHEVTKSTFGDSIPITIFQTLPNKKNEIDSIDFGQNGLKKARSSDIRFFILSLNTLPLFLSKNYLLLCSACHIEGKIQQNRTISLSVSWNSRLRDLFNAFLPTNKIKWIVFQNKLIGFPIHHSNCLVKFPALYQLN